jgi:hypothetical protein
MILRGIWSLPVRILRKPWCGNIVDIAQVTTTQVNIMRWVNGVFTP